LINKSAEEKRAVKWQSNNFFIAKQVACGEFTSDK